MLGNFNSFHITSLLSDLHQSVTCLTCLNKAIDLCYGNIPDAFESLCRPVLGHSDHNMIHLVPKYRQMLKRDKPRTHCVRLRVWDNDSSEGDVLMH